MDCMLVYSNYTNYIQTLSFNKMQMLSEEIKLSLILPFFFSDALGTEGYLNSDKYLLLYYTQFTKHFSKKELSKGTRVIRLIDILFAIQIT